MSSLHAFAVASALALLGCTRATPDPSAATLDRIERARAAYAAVPDAQRPKQHEYVRQAVGLIDQGRFDEARQFLESLAALPGHADEARFMVALTMHKEMRYSEARPVFEEVLDHGPTFEKAHSTLFFYAWCLYYLGERDAARAAFEAYLTLDPAEDDALFGLGLIALDADDLETSKTRFEEAFRLADAAGRLPQAAKASARLGDVLLAQEKLPEARDAFVRCLQLDPAATAVYYKLARVQLRLGDEKGAARHMKRYEQLLAEQGR